MDASIGLLVAQSVRAPELVTTTSVSAPSKKVGAPWNVIVPVVCMIVPAVNWL